jgi:hypothetical protein
VYVCGRALVVVMMVVVIFIDHHNYVVEFTTKVVNFIDNITKMV